MRRFFDYLAIIVIFFAMIICLMQFMVDFYSYETLRAAFDLFLASIAFVMIVVCIAGMSRRGEL